MTFNELNLKAEIISAINELGYANPMPIQGEVIPFILNQSKDLVALAQTGTGKTAAFGLPILNLIDSNLHKVQALILSPTRELSIQITNDLRKYAKAMRNIHIVAVYGGEDIRKQLKELDRTPQIIVATPGRLIDLIERGKIKLNDVNYLVLDEADEMLNMGFKEEIEIILKETPATRKTYLFSATMPNEIARIAKQYMQNYEEITVGNKNEGTENVKHIYYIAQARHRYLVLKRIVDLNPDVYGIVFCRTRQETKEVADKLIQDGYNADALHGDLSQAQRDMAMNKFRIRHTQLLVATDVAARGLDVNDLTHVINYNLPDEIEAYTHRSGRTGRANKTGISVSIIHTKEKFKIRDIEKILNRKFELQQIPNGLEVCKKQLFHQINKMQHVKVNDEQIEPYMQQIMVQLDYLPKEELLKRFVSLEFNRFLDYYKNAEDLNVPESSTRERNNDRSSYERKTGKKSGNRVRLKINRGSNDGINPKRFLGMINNATNDKSISIGNIEITNKYTFFDVFEDQKMKIMKSLEQESDMNVSEAKGSKTFSKSEAKGSKTFSENENRDSYQQKPRRKHPNFYEERNNSDKPWRNRKRRK
jgi:ATP-dependent RNA helicase DeaD